MNNHTPQQIEIEFPETKLCECGCGQPAPLAKKTNNKRGWIKGKPIRFVNGHHGRPPIERFWKKADRRGPDDCWLWTSTATWNGYGALRVDGKTVSAHRFSYELHNGEIPAGMCVCHTCDNRPCVNPSHLFLGTPQDNMSDKVDKGRQPRGEKIGNSKLTPEKVRRIRELRENGMTLDDIAGRLSVDPATIWRVVNLKNWKHI